MQGEQGIPRIRVVLDDKDKTRKAVHRPPTKEEEDSSEDVPLHGPSKRQKHEECEPASTASCTVKGETNDSPIELDSD